jgi:predicted Zn-dependent protease
MSQISLTIEQALDSASKSLEAGQLAQCEQLLRLVLQADPQQPDALHLFGLLCVRVGEAAAGVGFIEQAIALRADWPEAQRSYAYALAKSGRRGDAIKHLITWCMVHASDAEAWLMLAKHLQRVGQLDEARKALTAALTAQPGWAYAYTALGHLELRSLPTPPR